MGDTSMRMTVGVAGDSYALHVLRVPNIVSDLVKFPSSSREVSSSFSFYKKSLRHTCVCVSVCGQGVPQAGELYNVLAMPETLRRCCAPNLL